MLNLYYISFEFPPVLSGGTFRAFRFSKHLPSHGIRPIIFCLDPHPNAAEYATDSNFEIDLPPECVVVRVPLRKEGIRRDESYYFKLVDSISENWRKLLFEQLSITTEKFKPDILLITAPPFSLAALAPEIKSFLKVPLILDMRDAWSQWVTAPFASFVHYKLALNQFKTITSTSANQLMVLNKYVPDKKQCMIVRTGMDFSMYDSKDDLCTLDKVGKKKFILFPRNMRPVYNHEFEIDALSGLPDEILDEYYCVFVNGDSKDQAHVDFIKKRLDENKRLKCVILPTLGREAMYTLYRHCSLVVMVPKSDGSPVSAMEAMAFEKPLILGPIDYDPELFSHASVVRLRSWSEDELRNSITDILKSPIRVEWLRAGSKHIWRNANFEIEMDKGMSLYTKLAHS